MNRFPLLLLALLTSSFFATSPATAQAPSPIPAPASKAYCLPAAQLRVVDTALQQFEALKPIVVKLRLTNARLGSVNEQLRTALTLADSAQAYNAQALSQQARLRANAEGQWRKYQAKSARRGWIIGGLLGLLLTGVALSLH